MKSQQTWGVLFVCLFVVWSDFGGNEKGERGRKKVRDRDCLPSQRNPHNRT